MSVVAIESDGRDLKRWASVVTAGVGAVAALGLAWQMGVGPREKSFRSALDSLEAAHQVRRVVVLRDAPAGPEGQRASLGIDYTPVGTILRVRP